MEEKRRGLAPPPPREEGGGERAADREEDLMATFWEHFIGERRWKRSWETRGTIWCLF